MRDAVGPNELKNLYVDGGETIRQFMDAGLLSTLCLSRFLKVELGRGVPLLEKKGSDMLSAMKPAYKVRERERERGVYIWPCFVKCHTLTIISLCHFSWS